MRKVWSTAAVAAMALGLFVSPANRAVAGDPARQKPCQLDRTIRVSMQYLLYLPKDYDQKESWPLLLFLHGAGERGDNLKLVKKHGPPKLIEAGQQFPFIVVSPQCPEDQWWGLFDLTALLDEIIEKHKVDQDRVYVTGLSMGGFGTWSLAAYTPYRFAAIVPICGGGNPSCAGRIAHIPVWAFHGAKDPTVQLTQSQRMVDALKKEGGNVKFTVYPEAKHDSWTESYANPQLYEWLLQQKRTAKTAGLAAYEAMNSRGIGDRNKRARSAKPFLIDIFERINDLRPVKNGDGGDQRPAKTKDR